MDPVLIICARSLPLFCFFPFPSFLFFSCDGRRGSVNQWYSYISSQLICISDREKAQLVRSTEGSSYLGIKLAKGFTYV
jgi:hypothetical protein